GHPVPGKLLADAVGDGLAEALRPVWEVVVEEVAGDAGPLRHLLESDLRMALLGGDSQGCLDQLLAPLRGRHSPCRCAGLHAPGSLLLSFALCNYPIGPPSGGDELRSAAANLVGRRPALAVRGLEDTVHEPPFRPDPVAVDVADHIAVARELAPLHVIEGGDE